MQLITVSFTMIRCQQDSKKKVVCSFQFIFLFIYLLTNVRNKISTILIQSVTLIQGLRDVTLYLFDNQLAL